MRNWLTREARGPLEHTLLVCITLITMFALAIVAASELPYTVPIDPVLFGYEHGREYYTLIICVYFAIVLCEEIFFCALPIAIACAVNRTWCTALVLTAFAITFGFYPVHTVFPFEAKLVLVLCRGLLLFLFIKMGGWSVTIKWKALCVVVIVHYATGMLAFALMAIKNLLNVFF